MPGAWDLAASAAKFLVHAGLAGLCGAILLLLLFAQRPGTRRGLVTYGVAGSALGLLGSGLFFLVQVGTVLGRGAAGMLDGPMAAILWTTPLGTSLAFRGSGFGLAVLSLAAYDRFDRIDDGPPLPRRLALALIGLAAAVLVGAGSAHAGHTAVVGPWTQLALAAHAVAAGAWIGALPPLLWMTFREAPAELAAALRRFGDVARGIVAVLLVAGTWMTVQLVVLPQGLWGSPWGLLLTGKLALTGLLLALAGANRYRWVPGLAAGAASRAGIPLGATPGEAGLALRRSILAELLLGTALLLLTGQLSTVFGPEGH